MKVYSVLVDGFHIDHPHVSLFDSEDKAMAFVRECWGQWSADYGADMIFPEPTETWESLVFTFDDGLNNEWYYVTEHDEVQ